MFEGESAKKLRLVSIVQFKNNMEDGLFDNIRLKFLLKKAWNS
jgi:hypothetical protein